MLQQEDEQTESAKYQQYIDDLTDESAAAARKAKIEALTAAMEAGTLGGVETVSEEGVNSKSNTVAEENFINDLKDRLRKERQ